MLSRIKKSPSNISRSLFKKEKSINKIQLSEIFLFIAPLLSEHDLTTLYTVNIIFYNLVKDNCHKIKIARVRFIDMDDGNVNYLCRKFYSRFTVLTMSETTKVRKTINHVDVRSVWYQTYFSSKKIENGIILTNCMKCHKILNIIAIGSLICDNCGTTNITMKKLKSK